jgi:hypothetical protein
MVPQELGDLLPQRPLIPHGGSAALGDSRELSRVCIYKEHSSHGQSHSFSILIIISIESTCIEAIEPSTSHHINRAAIASKQHVCYQTHIPHLPRSITAGPLLSQQRLPHSEIERAQCCIAIAISTLSKPGMSMRSSQMLQAQLTNPFKQRLMPADDSDSGQKYDDVRGDFFTHLLSALGLEELSNLNHLENWKDETQPADPKKNTDRNDKASPTENTTAHAPDSFEHDKEEALRNPVKDPLGYASDLLDLVSGEIKEAIDSSDERTLN